jgi:HEAT repeat protein
MLNSIVLLLMTSAQAGSIDAAVRKSPAEHWVAWEYARVKDVHDSCSRGVVGVRVSAGRVDKVGLPSHNCELDTAGLPVEWVKSVPAAESLAFLSRLSLKGAIAAIALHDTPAADAALETYLKPGQSVELRKDAAFWLGAARGAAGERRLERVLADDSSQTVREHAVFALSISKDAAALPALIGVSKHDRDAEVRGKALFWMAQKAGKKAVAALGEAADHDPETKVKRQAVFALSQLPEGEGVPELIRVARTHQNREVRKQAFFWLGQSKDPRAAGFLEEVLTR